MKGLIRNTFYSMENNIKLAFLLSGILVFTPFFIKDATILSLIISVQIFLFIANIGPSLHADEVAKWDKFELTLPVEKHVVIMAKYISFLILILFGFLVSILTSAIAVFTTASLDITSILWGCEYGLTLSIMVASIMYPVMLKIGTEKNELVLMLCAFLSVLFMLFIAFLMAPFTSGMDFRSLLAGTASVFASLLLLPVSYLVSLRIYNNKEI